MANAAPEPQEFGKYQILERIAAGGMAEIFKARIDGIGGFHRTIAIKRILPHLSANPEFVDMLVDEAKIAGLLSHANIVQILDLGAVEGQYYIAMEFVDGRDLGKLLDRCGRKGITLPVPHAVYVLLEILKGLDYAHNRQVQRGGKPVPLKIVHRDISPGNVLVSFQGEVKLTDFGIAKASVKALETMSGVIKGRFDFMSPEQASGQPADLRSDIFSAGILLYILLTGRHPFRQASELATVEAIRKGEFELPSTVNPDVPPALDAAVERALALNPDDRFSSAAAFKEALDKFFQDSGFIFSASTLGAFVRGLFPESDPKAARNVPTRSTARPLDEQVARDTGMQDVGALLRTLPNAPDPASPAAFGEESTIIRPAPTPAAPAGTPAQNPWTDVDTVIRPDALKQLQNNSAETIPLPSASNAARAEASRFENETIGLPTRGGAPPPAPPIPAQSRHEAPTVEFSALTREFDAQTVTRAPTRVPADDRQAPSLNVPSQGARGNAPREAPQGPPRRPSVVYRTPSHVHVIYVVVSFAALALGLLVGVLLGSARTGAGGDPILIHADPVLEIHFPDKAKVAVGGRSVPGASPVTTRVSPNKATVVQVSMDGYSTLETSVTLDYNQMRVLAFTPVDLKPKAP